MEHNKSTKYIISNVRESEIVTCYWYDDTGEVSGKAKVKRVYNGYLSVIPIGESEPITVPVSMLKYRGYRGITIDTQAQGYLGV